MWVRKLDAGGGDGVSYRVFTPAAVLGTYNVAYNDRTGVKRRYTVTLEKDAWFSVDVGANNDTNWDNTLISLQVW